MLTQLPSVVGFIPNSRATEATARGPSSTMRTASSLNSGENCLRRLVTYLPLPDSLLGYVPDCPEVVGHLTHSGGCLT